LKSDELRQCAAETLMDFLQTMPDAPFTVSDIIFSFAKQSEMASRALELCAQYCPDKKLNESQLYQLGESIAANALIGREKSAVLICTNTKIGKTDFRRLIVHELTHIFCVKSEMDGEHFIDIYGSGTTPDVDPVNREYDGLVVAGYKVWSEFIAQYYAVKLVDKETIDFARIADFINSLFHEVNVHEIEDSKTAFSMICAYWFNCVDFDETLAALNEPGTFMPGSERYGKETQDALCDCINYLHNQMQKDKPWKITEKFIYYLGDKFSKFRMINTLYLES